jgi:WD40 repeat protein
VHSMQNGTKSTESTTADGSPLSTLRTLAGHEGAVLALCLSADGQTLFSGGYDRTIRFCATLNSWLRHFSVGGVRRIF